MIHGALPVIGQKPQQVVAAVSRHSGRKKSAKQPNQCREDEREHPAKSQTWPDSGCLLRYPARSFHLGCGERTVTYHVVTLRWTFPVHWQRRIGKLLPWTWKILTHFQDRFRLHLKVQLSLQHPKSIACVPGHALSQASTSCCGDLNHKVHKSRGKQHSQTKWGVQQRTWTVHRLEQLNEVPSISRVVTSFGSTIVITPLGLGTQMLWVLRTIARRGEGSHVRALKFIATSPNTHG